MRAGEALWVRTSSLAMFAERARDDEIGCAVRIELGRAREVHIEAGRPLVRARPISPGKTLLKGTAGPLAWGRLLCGDAAASRRLRMSALCLARAYASVPQLSVLAFSGLRSNVRAGYLSLQFFVASPARVLSRFRE